MRANTVLILISICLLLGLSSSPLVEAQSQGEEDEMIRIIMLPPEAEVTGMYVDEHGRFFVNAMHPDEDQYNATIGVITGVDWNNLPDVVPELDASSKAGDVWHGIRTGYGQYQVLLQTGDTLSDGQLAGGIYSIADGQQILLSQKPDFNAFIPTNQDGTSGFLYTAWEDRPAGNKSARDSMESELRSVGCSRGSNVESFNYQRWLGPLLWYSESVGITVVFRGIVLR